MKDLKYEVARQADLVKLKQESKEAFRKELLSEKNKLGMMEGELNAVCLEQRTDYEAYRNGSLDVESFLSRRKVLEHKEDVIENELDRQRRVVSVLENRLEDVCQEELLNVDKLIGDGLTQELADGFLEYVKVSPKNVVEVGWKF